MKPQLLFAIALTVFLFLSASTPPTCSDCSDSQVQIVSPTGECKFIFNATQSNCNTKLWHGSGFPNEDYYMCWVFSDGSFNGFPYSVTPGPVNILSGAPPTGTKVAFTTACNRYGDDDDKMRVWGGYTGTPSPPGLSYSLAPTSQTLPGPASFQINTSHGTDNAANCNQLLLIISCKSDSSFPTGDVRLNLYCQGKEGQPIDYYKYPGIPLSSTYPSGNNSYFEFAEPLTTAAQTISGLSAVASWKVLNFSGKVKNVYCLLTVPNVGASDEHQIADTFTAKLTDISNQSTVYKTTTKKITIRAAYDPNIISVDKDTSHVCGKSPEELEYTIRFQNTGTGKASRVGINLHLDAALDKSSLMVTEVGVGHNVYTTPAGAVSPSLGANAPFSFSYSTSNPSSVFPITANQHPTVSADAAFVFSQTDFLEGSNAVDIEDSKGYVKFTIKTSSVYPSIHNRAGIFFDDNDEVATNLAVTTCADPEVVGGSDSCAKQLSQCNEQLKHCKSNCHDIMYWLGWIIAGIEFLLLIFLLMRKKK